MPPFDPHKNGEAPTYQNNAAGALILSAIAVAFFYPLIFDGKVIFYRDFQFITYPFRYALAQAYQQGVIPYWTTHTFGGMPFMATLHPGVFYPPSVFFFLPDTTLAVNLFYVFHFWLAGIFVFLLGRIWNLSWWSSMCCGLTGMLSGYLLASALCSNFFLSSVWLPVIFWFYYQWEGKKHAAYFAGLVLAIATQTLAACPEISVMTILLLFAHSMMMRPDSLQALDYIRVTATLGLAVLLALGITAFQLAPTASLLPYTFRGGGLDFDFHANWSLSPAKLATYIFTPGYDQYLTSRDVKVNYFSGLLHSIYMGVFGYVFVLFALMLRKDKAIAFWLAVFLTGIFFALGKYNPVYETFYRWVPFLDMFRYPEKYFFISAFAAVFLIGYGIDALGRRTEEQSLKVSTVAAFWILTAGGVWVFAVWSPAIDPRYPFVFILAFGLGYALLYLGKVRTRGFAAFLFVLIFMDLFVRGADLLPLIDRKFYETRPLLMDILDGSAGKYRTYTGRIKHKPEPSLYPISPTRLAGVRAAKQHLYPTLGMVYGVEHVGGVPGLAMDLKNHILWYQYLIQSDEDRRWRILKRSNVKYWIDGDAPTYYTRDGYPVILPDRIKIIDDALPRAFLVSNMRVAEPGKDFVTYYDADFDPRQEVLLATAVKFQPSPHFNGTVREVAYQPNHVTVKTSQTGNGFLVLLDTYLPGWTVTVDGREQTILKANALYRAVQLEPGEHTLEFDYWPEGFKAGLMVTGVTPVLGLVGYLLWRRRFKGSDGT